MRTRLLLAITALSMAVVAGCTTTSEGVPLPGSNATTKPSLDDPSTDDGLPSDGAPKVENPLDVSRFEQKPCDALTSQQTKELNVPLAGEQKGDSLGETCYWRNSQTRGSVSLSLLSGDERGLSSLYREAEGKVFPYFESIDDIEGHPAMAFNTTEAKPTIECGVGVGVTDKLALLVLVGLSDARIGNRDPCEAATQVAGMAMKTMKEAA
ncbi:DUF3558 domain-containing protein [Actinophytocola sp.]|uniref:DUF3558 domain-containing protein n=1 Tax=Actinophytocola sp. TaxID=1872138 RepID=UPI002ED2A7E9